jgi:hypothetical protein
VAPARHLVIERGGPLGPVRADPLGVGVDGGQRLQGLVVARAQAHHLADALGGPLEIPQLLAQHPAPAQQQLGPPLGVRGGGQLQLVQAHHAGEIPEGAVDLARRLDGLEVLGGDLGAAGGAGQGPLQLGQHLPRELGHLGL